MRNLWGSIFFILIIAGAFGSTLLYLQSKAPVEFTQKENTDFAVPAPTSTIAEATSTKLTVPLLATSTEVKKVTIIPKEIITPGVLVAPKLLKSSSQEPLTVDGVLFYTNEARQKNGELSPLVKNEQLNKSAQIKLADMFAKQYFEHVSPTGQGPAELAMSVGYEYVTVGENLALGDFENDVALIEAWMNSPGHRANILNSRYTEIGIAVGKGIYQGAPTWLAVQSFGMPLSLCPKIDALLREKIERNNAEIASMQSALDARRARVEATPQSDPSYNKYVSEYNELIPSFNELVALNKGFVENYNAQVKSFNECVLSGAGH